MRKRMYRLFVVLLLIFSNASSGQTRPNIIYIMVDDMGYGDLSSYGRQDYKTPNVDKLGMQGMKFITSYSGGPLCTPTRTSFMTGRYPARTPIGLLEPLPTGDSSIGLKPETTSIVSLMQKNGYETVLVGKWHLGFTPEFSPLKNGFDEFFGFKGGALDYISHTDILGNNDLYENDTLIKRDGYLTDLLSERALSVINRPHRKPFFLCLMFNAPHWPWQAPGDSVYPKGRLNWMAGGSPATYAAMMKSMDDAVGRIMKALEQKKLANNTVVIFVSDNGGEKYSDMGVLKGKKGDLWEGGIRVPAMIRWPGKIPEKSISRQVVITMDWSATILALAKVKPDPTFPPDGMDIMPICQGKTKVISRTLYWRVFQRKQQKAMREGDWKYLQDENGEYLFDLSKDQAESVNLKEQNASVFESLKNKFAAWEKTVLSPVPARE
jgi:arylsulfatase A-like enzyme